VLPGVPEPLPGAVASGPKTSGIAVEPLVFPLPAVDLGEDDHRTWMKKVDEAWKTFRRERFGPYLKKCTRLGRRSVLSGLLVDRKTRRTGGLKRQAIPVELRYELAAQRYCLGKSWGALQRQCDSLIAPTRFESAVTKILSALEL
jgi:hypothetical protein